MYKVRVYAKVGFLPSKPGRPPLALPAFLFFFFSLRALRLSVRFFWRMAWLSFTFCTRSSHCFLLFSLRFWSRLMLFRRSVGSSLTFSPSARASAVFHARFSSIAAA